MTTDDLAKGNYRPDVWRVYACHPCRAAWLHPLETCPECGARLARVPAVGAATYQAIAESIPGYRVGPK